MLRRANRARAHPAVTARVETALEATAPAVVPAAVGTAGPAGNGRGGIGKFVHFPLERISTAEYVPPPLLNPFARVVKLVDTQG